jgi:hypothetical protein
MYGTLSYMACGFGHTNAVSALVEGIELPAGLGLELWGVASLPQLTGYCVQATPDLGTEV